MLALTAPALAQKGFETTIPDAPVSIYSETGFVSVQGHWVALDKHSALTGPSVSKITCDRRRCVENLASMIVDADGSFQLSADTNEYKVERWTPKEIVASTVSGDCRVREVLKFDLVEKRVYYMRTFSEPLDANLPKLSKEACKDAAMNLELKADTMWKKWAGQ
jgi:hypothetical protein